MEQHVIDLPKRVVVGRGVLEAAAHHVRDLGIQGPLLLVTGSSVTRSYGQKLRQILEDGGYDIFLESVTAADVDNAERILSIAREARVRAVVGLGGGKAIDVAKYVAAKLGVPMVSVPTAPSHDGIASPFATIRGLGRPTSIRAVMPTLVIADTSIIAQAPRRLIIAGCGDLIGKFTAVLDWKLAHKLRGEYYGEYAASLALLSAKHVVKYSALFAAKIVPEEAVRALVEALISSGVAMGIAGSTRPASGSEHMFAHALDVVAGYPALHGEEVGIGTIMMAYLHGKNWRRIRRVLQRIGAPTTAKEIGVPDTKIVEALTIAHTIRPERYTILGEKGLSWEAAEKLARITGVIE